MNWFLKTIFHHTLKTIFKRSMEHVYWLDSQGLYLGCNDAYCKFLHLKHETDVIGQNPELFVESLGVQIQDTHRTSNVERPFLRKYHLPSHECMSVQVSRTCFYGITLFSEHDMSHYTDSIAALHEKINFLEKNYNKTEAYLDNLVQIVPASIYWKDRDSVILGSNLFHTKLAGFHSPKEVLGKTEYDFVWKDQAEEIIAADQQIMLSGKGQKFEETATLSDGKIHHFITSKDPLRDKNNHVIGIIGISTDITSIKEMEEDLRIAKQAAEAASQAKTEFIANMGHDIRTPLTGIIGLSRHLEEEIHNSDQKECAKQVCESGEQLLGLLNGVLDLITMDAQHEDSVIYKSLDIRQVMHDVLTLERPAVTARHLDIEMHIDDAIPQYLESDEMKLHRILLNLAGNAIKFTKIGHIELNARLLSSSHDSVQIEFSVVDTGIGIPEELQGKVFDQFFKVSPSYKGLYAGNGIGLHIVQKYVGLLGGEIHLKSQVGVGTTVSFSVSMAIGQKPEHVIDESVASLSAVKATEHIEMKVISPSRQPNILLVEDNIPALHVLKIMMKKFPVHIDTAVDAETAFDLVKSKAIDLLITDIGLPGYSGDELTAMIRHFEKQHHRQPMMIIGLTGHAIKEIRQTCLKAGMNGVYLKPISTRTLNMLIETLTKSPEEPPSVKLQSPPVALGDGLPDVESQLFDIDQYPLLDITLGIKTLGSETLARDILMCLKTEGIHDDLILIQQAYATGDWKTVEKLSHKMKGGACFGTVRLYYALLYMERYLKAGHVRCVEALYSQMLRVIHDTSVYLEDWLKGA